MKKTERRLAGGISREAPRDRGGCHGEQFGPVITGKQRGGGSAKGRGGQREEPYNLGRTAPCLLV